MEIDVVAPTKKKAFDGECYNCGKKGHLARDCRGPIKNQKSGRFQGSKKTKHAKISWIGCYDDSCNIHQSDKDGAGWYPQQSRQIAVVGKEESDRYGTHPTEEDFTKAKNRYSPMYPDGPDEQTEAEQWIQDAEEQLRRELLVSQTSSELAREDAMDKQRQVHSECGSEELDKLENNCARHDHDERVQETARQIREHRRLKPLLTQLTH